MKTLTAGAFAETRQVGSAQLYLDSSGGKQSTCPTVETIRADEKFFTRAYIFIAAVTLTLSYGRIQSQLARECGGREIIASLVLHLKNDFYGN